MSVPLTRRTWLTSQALTAAAFVTRFPRVSVLLPRVGWPGPQGNQLCRVADAATLAAHAEQVDVTSWQTMAQQAAEAARSAGAQYADARLTRIVLHRYGFGGMGNLNMFQELVGVGVRTLVNGYWGFAASAVLTPEAVVRLARAAAAQAQENAKGTPRRVDLGTIPTATGTWTTPIRIDPFAISIEEKLDNILNWKDCAAVAGVPFDWDGAPSWLQIVRQERVVATSEGALFTQTLYESSAEMNLSHRIIGGGVVPAFVRGLDVTATGWELFQEAKVLDQFPQLRQELDQTIARAAMRRPSIVGRYTLVCDGATMAALVDATLGVATQLDRALGYEANAGGTSFIDDPLAMVGALHVTAPLVTLTANRSAPKELATVKWDDEGVEPQPFTLIQNGVLTDFQTTREQAAWLAPYYQRQHRPVRSNGCAAAEDAHHIPLQQTPNLSLEPSASAIRLEDLIADVPTGILVEEGAVQCDFQARTGLLTGSMREITQGRLGRPLTDGAVQFTTKDLWARIAAVGGVTTQMRVGTTQYTNDFEYLVYGGKGQPPSRTSHSVRAVAATIPNQPVINPSRKA